MEQIEEQLRRVADRLTSMANSQSIVAKPISQGQAVAIPLCEITFGFGGALGSGGAADKPGGSGAGVAGGLVLTPKAVVVVDTSGARMISLED